MIALLLTSIILFSIAVIGIKSARKSGNKAVNAFSWLALTIGIVIIGFLGYIMFFVSDV